MKKSTQIKKVTQLTLFTQFTQFTQFTLFTWLKIIVQIFQLDKLSKLSKPGKLGFLFFIISSLIFTTALYAKVTGPCVNCHTMHNSQNGQAMNRGDTPWGGSGTLNTPNETLLNATCLGCHSSTDGETIKTLPGGQKVPIVFNTTGYPANPLSGGNFYWVSTGVASSENDTKGHNVFLGNGDDNLSSAPGDVGGGTCGGVNACHKNLYASTSPPSFGFPGARQGCTKCHMVGTDFPKGYHHINDTDPLKNSTSDGWFRFLSGHQSGSGHGVTGLIDVNWQHDASSTVHNEYLGYSGTKTSAGGFSALGNTMTAYCTGCHGNFHIEQSTSNAWIRHPSDAVIPNSGEFASAYNATGGTGTYDPRVPVARPTLNGWTTPDATVRLGTDLVMCLSCHRAHGSPYSKIMRWDYKGWPASGEFNGCTVCHTGKN